MDHHPIDIRRAVIAARNDQLRRSGWGGRVVVTHGVASRGVAFTARALAAVAAFEDFTEDNDPYGEHDFGRVEVDGERLCFKIDYYDKRLVFGSADPSDPTITARVMTVMFAAEY